MKWEAIVDLPMMEAKNCIEIGVSSPRDEIERIHKTQEVTEVTSVDILMMGTMIHNRMGVSSSINGE